MTKNSTRAAAVTVSASDKLTKTQLSEQIAARTSLSQKQARAAIDALLKCVISSLQHGQSVTLSGVGTFTVKATAARSGVKPTTSERLKIPAGKKVSYKVSSTLKGNL